MKHRNVTSSPFGFDATESEESFDPMASLANMTDVMLVFACGLIVMLVIYWNLDVNPALTQVKESENLSEFNEEVTSANTTLGSGESNYEELGVVYRDPSTGKLYMLKENASQEGSK